MGLYKIQFKNYSKQLVLTTMLGIGKNVIRTEERDIGEYFFYKECDGDERAFWIRKHAGEYYWCCGMGSGVDAIIQEFGTVGLFP